MRRLILLLILFANTIAAQSSLGGGTSGSTYIRKDILLQRDSSYLFAADVPPSSKAFLIGDTLVFPYYDKNNGTHLGMKFNLNTRVKTTMMATTTSGGFAGDDWYGNTNDYKGGKFGYTYLKNDSLVHLTFGHYVPSWYAAQAYKAFTFSSFSMTTNTAKRWYSQSLSTFPGEASYNTPIVYDNKIMGINLNGYSGYDYDFWTINTINNSSTSIKITPVNLWENLASYKYYTMSGLFMIGDTVYAITSPYSVYPEVGWEKYPNKGVRIVKHDNNFSNMGAGWTKIFEFPDSVITSSPLIEVVPDSNIAYILFEGDKTKEFHGLYEFNGVNLGKIRKPAFLPDSVNVKNFFFKRDRNGYDYNTLYVNYASGMAWATSTDTAFTCKLNISTKTWNDTVYVFKSWMLASNRLAYTPNQIFYDNIHDECYLYQPRDNLLQYNIYLSDGFQNNSQRLMYIPANVDAGNFVASEPVSGPEPPKVWKRAVIRRQPLTQQIESEL